MENQGDPTRAKSEERDPRTYAIIGAAMEVHRHLGSGFLEAVYQEALEMELAERQVPCEREKRIQISYKGKTLKKEYVADFVGFGEVIVEVKAISALTEIEDAQLINYLKATGLKVGLLLNFHGKSLQYKRLVLGA
jgi:GxxExxY protein